MFDDQKTNQGTGAPANLPLNEPEDIFSDADDVGAVDTMDTATAEVPAEPAPVYSSAVDAGKLTPRETAPVEERPRVVAENPKEGLESIPSLPPQDISEMKGPVLSKAILFTVVSLVVIAIVGGGGWWIYSSFVLDNTIDDGFGSGTTIATDTTVVDTETTTPIAPSTEINNSEVSSEVIDNEILFGEGIDSDSDRLGDSTEEEIGTDPNNWDTDNDRLSDGDEVLTWGTDPLNPDSDSDGFLDGDEVLSHYDPMGPGKLTIPVTNTPK